MHSGFAIILLILCVSFAEAEFNFTFTYAAKCKPFHTLDGYAYRTFFELEDLQHSRTPVQILSSDAPMNYRPPDDNSTYVHMHIGVLAKADAHILFTEIPNASSLNPVYEIVLGAGGNSYSEIRRSRRSNSLKSVRTANILSVIRYTVFWIRITSDGVIEVGKEGDIIPFMAVKDPNPLTIKYFSLSSWGSSKATWLYDCPSPDGEESDTDSKRVLSVREKLSDFLLTGYEPPSILINSGVPKQINLHHSINYVSLNPKEAILEVRGKMEMTWMDPKLKWNATEFSNITSMRFGIQHIWQPPLFLLNAAKSTGSEVVGSAPLDVTSEGVVSWNVPTHYKTWCNLGEGITQWPNDKHICDVQLAPWSLHRLSNIAFDITLDYSKGSTGSDWILTSTYTTNSFYNISDISIEGAVINLHLMRKSSSLNTLFHAPFIASVVLSMLSLWMYDGFRTSVACLGALILAPPFAMLGNLVPAHHTHVPVIVNLYVLGFFISWIMLVMAVLGSWFRKAPPNQPPPFWILTCLDCKIIRWLMCLSSVEGDSYENLMNLPKSESTWVTVGNALDRIVFLIVGIALATSLLTAF